MFINITKANFEISRLKGELETVTKDKDLQIKKLAEFEATHKEYIESAQTAEQMKQSHSKELETLKAEYELKLSEKDKELLTVKESLTKQVETVKAESAKEISTVKEQVAAETIAIVASQGTNVAIETIIPKESVIAEREPRVKYKVISHGKQS